MPGVDRTVSVTINGVAREHDEGATLLDAMKAAGVDVPHLCHDDRLAPIGACRLCIVSVDGFGRPVTACNTPVRDGMAIHTHTPELEALRRTNLSLIADRYPLTIADDEPGLAFGELLATYKVSAGGQIPDTVFRDESHPYLAIDMERCIHCYRCVRICEQVEGADVWQVWGRGAETAVAPRDRLSLLDAGCTSCGACADTCPTGAIADKRARPADQWTRSTCVYCGVGCQMEVGDADGQIVTVRPAKSVVNQGHLCVKGRYAFEFNRSDDRVITPMIRSGDRWSEVSWDDALDETAARLQAILDREPPDGGPDAIGILGSARATNEENYYAQKFARVVVGTNNVDCCGRVCHQPTAKAMKMMLGTGAATNSFDDIERAKTIFIAGCNPLENHPIVGARIRQAVRRGAKLIVLDPRRTALAEIADVHLAVRPGRNIPLLGALASVILAESLVDREFLASRVDGVDEYVRSLQSFDPDDIAQACGVSAQDIRSAARLYATCNPSMCFHGLGITEHLQGTDGVSMLVNLALLTGNIGKPGTGINPLRGQNNVQGSAHMGCEPRLLAGGQPLRDPEVLSKFQSAWGVTLPTGRGLNLLEMMDNATAGSFKALWAFGYDVYLTLANEAATARAMSKLELVVVQDLFMNKTAERFGHIFLPAASVFEKDGTFMNSDRRVQRVRRVLSPAGQSRPDSWIFAQVAKRLGYSAHFEHPSAEAIWDEIRSVWPAGAGLSYARLDRDLPGAPQWPCPDEEHPGTPMLHQERFAHAERASLRPVAFTPSPEKIDPAYPYRLTTGRHLHQFNAGTMTRRTPNIQLRSTDELEISPVDAEALGLQSGDWATVQSRHGQIDLPVRVLDRIRPGDLFTTFHDPDLFVNRVTSSVRDRSEKTPEYKFTAVTITARDS